MIKRKAIQILFIILSPFFLVSQSQKISVESAYKELASAPDTTRCKKLNYISRELVYNYPDSALVLADSARRIAERIGYKRGLAYSYFMLGMVRQNQGKNDIAIGFYDKSLELYKELNSKNDQANIYNSVANVYLQIGVSGEAERNYQECLRLAEQEPKSKYYIAIASAGLANVEATKKNYKKVSDYLLISMKNFRESGQAHYVPLVMQNLSENYLDMNDFVNAEKYNDEVIPLLDSMGNNYGLCMAYSTRSRIFEHKGDKQKAVEYANKAYEYGLKINAYPEMAARAKRLYELFKGSSDYKSALSFLEKFITFNDSVNNQARNASLAEAETKFYTKQKEYELEKKNIELESSQSEVKLRNRLIYLFISAFAIVAVLLFLVFRSDRERKKANLALKLTNNEIEKQKAVIETKNKDITDSINYSRYIQNAIIPDESVFRQYFRQHLVFYRPKDIISGDFFILEEVVGQIYLAVIDCTGHGVPGAMLSVFASSTLRNSIAGNTFRSDPGAVLSDLCYQFKTQLQAKSGGISINDGVDMALCIIDPSAKKLYYAGARNGMSLCRDGKLTEYQGNRWGISGSNIGEHMFFNTHEIDFQDGDRIYMYTDGFADQFGGEKGKKMKHKALIEMIEASSTSSMEEQVKDLNSNFEAWKGNLEQIDDVTIVGVQL